MKLHSQRCRNFYILILLLFFSSLRVSAQVLEEDLNIDLSEIDEMLELARRSDSDVEIEFLANKCLVRSKSNRYESGLVRSYLLLGDVSARTGRSEKALRHYLEAEDKASSSHNRQFLPLIYRSMGDLFFSKKMYPIASKYYQLSLKEKEGDLYILEKAADASLFGMQYDTAEFFYKKLITKYKEDGNYGHLVHIYQKLATAYSETGNSGKTLLYYLRIEDIITRFGQPYEKGRLFNNLGKVYAKLGDYKKALDYFKKTELQCQFAEAAGVPCSLPELLYVNMGIALHNTNSTKEGINYLKEARKVLVERGDQISQANVEHILATIYSSIGDQYNALLHNETAIQLANQTDQTDLLSRSYRTAADIYQDLYDFEKAFDSYSRYLRLSDSLRLEDQKRQILLAERSSELRAAEGEIRYLLAQQEIRERDLQQVRIEQEKLEQSNRALALAAKQNELELVLLQKQQEIDQATLREKTAIALQTQQQLRIAAQQLDSEKQNAVIASLREQEAIERAERLAGEQQVELLKKEKDIADLKILSNAQFEKNTYIIGGLGILILFFLGFSWWLARRSSQRLRLQNSKIEAQKNQIDNERSKSDQLLKNILPDEVAEELKLNGVAAPRLYDSVTVLFTDFVNFTKLSSGVDPQRIINELNECFLAFDEIIEKYRLEKIKTIGDAFMCAGGLPKTNDTHPVDAVLAALEISDWLKNRTEKTPGALFREMRIGIHTGPVVAGVVGKHKFAYDIWGDAVNLAARLEEQGEPGRVNISQVTYEAVKETFHCIPRGLKEVHNKGLVNMYFVESLKKVENE
jgi:adenylate cyclase